jgi:hypothetical protein
LTQVLIKTENLVFASLFLWLRFGDLRGRSHFDAANRNVHRWSNFRCRLFAGKFLSDTHRVILRGAHFARFHKRRALRLMWSASLW